MSANENLAEGEGFEPPLPLRVKRFSRPPVSTAHTSLRVRYINSLPVPENRQPGHCRDSLLLCRANNCSTLNCYSFSTALRSVSTSLGQRHCRQPIRRIFPRGEGEKVQAGGRLEMGCRSRGGSQCLTTTPAGGRRVPPEFPTGPGRAGAVWSRCFSPSTGQRRRPQPAQRSRQRESPHLDWSPSRPCLRAEIGSTSSSPVLMARKSRYGFGRVVPQVFATVARRTRPARSLSVPRGHSQMERPGLEFPLCATSTN